MFFVPTQRGSKNLRIPVELTAVARPPIEFELMTIDDFTSSIGEEYVFDIECYKNYFLVMFLRVKTGQFCYLEMDESSALDTDWLAFICHSVCLIGFNSKKYDNLMLAAARAGFDCQKLKEISDNIILDGMTAEDLEELYKIPLLYKMNGYDLIEVAPLAESLKKYAARMHARRLQELPYAPHEALIAEQKKHVFDYCIVDCQNTNLLRSELVGQHLLRVELGKTYDVDLRSKSDAQIAETVIISEIAKLKKYRPKKPVFSPDYVFAYKAPEYVTFKTPELQKALERIKELRFSLSANGALCQSELSSSEESHNGFIVTVNNTQYKLGLGGIHSCEKSQAVYASEGFGLFDVDVESFYPKLLLNNEWYPAHLGRDFLHVFGKIVDQRLQAKAAAALAKKSGEHDLERSWKIKSDSLKITINGSFGKLASPFSVLYSPDLLVQTTVTGQLTLLMLIEAFELNGIPVKSANTDGVVAYVHESQRHLFNGLVAQFEKLTNLKTEETAYSAIFNRDVNNYIAIKTDGEIKTKGVYSEKGSTGNSRLSKNPETLIVSDAVQAFLTKQTPIVNTINECRDLTRFVSVKNVKGGGHINGLFLGKTVRWYYGKNSRNTINYVDSGNTVGKSYGAVPCMDLPDDFPADIDYNRYITQALDELVNLGYTKRQDELF